MPIVVFFGTELGTYDKKAGFAVEEKISLKEIGLLWNAVTEAGEVAVRDEIRLQSEIQLIKQH